MFLFLFSLRFSFFFFLFVIHFRLPIEIVVHFYCFQQFFSCKCCFSFILWSILSRKCFINLFLMFVLSCFVLFCFLPLVSTSATIFLVISLWKQWRIANFPDDAISKKAIYKMLIINCFNNIRPKTHTNKHILSPPCFSFFVFCILSNKNVRKKNNVVEIMIIIRRFALFILVARKHCLNKVITMFYIDIV